MGHFLEQQQAIQPCLEKRIKSQLKPRLLAATPSMLGLLSKDQPSSTPAATVAQRCHWSEAIQSDARNVGIVCCIRSGRRGEFFGICGVRSSSLTFGQNGPIRGEMTCWWWGTDVMIIELEERPE